MYIYLKEWWGRNSLDVFVIKYTYASARRFWEAAKLDIDVFWCILDFRNFCWLRRQKFHIDFGRPSADQSLYVSYLAYFWRRSSQKYAKLHVYIVFVLETRHLHDVFYVNFSLLPPKAGEKSGGPLVY